MAKDFRVFSMRGRAIKIDGDKIDIFDKISNTNQRASNANKTLASGLF